MTNNYFIDQLQKILDEYLKLTQRPNQSYDLSNNSSLDELTELVSKSKSAIARIVGVNSEYYKDVLDSVSKNTDTGYKLMKVIGIVKALKSDLVNDYLKSYSEIIHSEIFSDYLEMAYHLAEEGYKDPAAVLAGSTPESHLKELCKSQNIEIETKNSNGKLIVKKADLLNSDLAKTKCYTLTYQKQITAWLDLRNNAAHGNYIKYTTEEVNLMIAGIRNFLLSHPA
jgi:hypothetical protein